MPGQGDCDEAEPGPRPLGKQPSVGDLVRNYDGRRASGTEDSQGKRDRSESGDSQPRAVKRGALDRSGERISPPQKLSAGEFRARLDDAMEVMETRLTSLLSRELHEFKENISSQFEALELRIRDLEQHVEARDAEVDDMSKQLREARGEVEALRGRAEDAELISRLPCLVLSGKAMARRSASRLDAPLPRPAGAVGPGSRAGPPPPPAPSPAQHGGSPDREQRGGPRDLVQRGGSRDLGRRGESGGAEVEQQEDINDLVVSTLNSCFPDLNMEVRDIDRAHRLPGANHRVIVRFVRSGAGSVRDAVFWRRRELKGKDLFVNESLTALRGKIFRSLLEAKKSEKLHTVYTRGGQVYFKPERHAVGQRVETLEKLTQLGFSVASR